MKTSILIKLLVLTSLIIVGISCTKSSSDSSGDSTNPPPSNGSGNNGPEARTNCGVVINGQVVNPISDSNGEAVRLEQVADSNGFIATTSAGKILIKLHGISSEPSALRNNAINFLDNYTGRTVLFIRATDNCTALLPGGGLAQVGQLITSAGESISESLVRTGFANASSSDGCGSELITTCLSALQESDPQTAGELDSFLWKPTSDSNGNLAIHTGPFGTTVSVNGEIGQNQGGGNGFGSLARFSRPGCAYGNNRVIVRSSSGFPYTVGGQTSFNVPDPCGRHCLQGGKIVACSKR